MTDVAKEAGCSQATVSFVLKNAPGVKISAETQQRVIDAAIKLGYRSTKFIHQAEEPNLAKPGPSTIGFVVDQLATSPEAVVAIDAARQASWQNGHILFSAQTMYDPELEAETLTSLAGQKLAGLIYMAIFTRQAELPEGLLDLPCPVVLLNCYAEETRFPSVVPDETVGGYRATRHLIEQGHRRIGMILGEPWMEATQDRQTGYERALAEAGIAFDPALVTGGNWTASSGYAGTRALLALDPRPTAIFCQNDRMAIGCYEALKEEGLRIPQDISVMGYDDEEIARHLNPPLSTVDLPHRAMGAWAVEQIERKRAGKSVKAKLTRMDCALVERDSVAAPRDE
ncbi:substrate-binding domain-containing protein [Rhodobacteraceae bacterium KN286]|uniref:Substrate-binding domain-containing protein n=2 Tax=Oceanomicrobium pacificus TaxID=2692916 RepID=A0A6B0U513_9RHOB|nr:substrate-binding domain-containing protein [Oceanomicrobium pacificus]